MIAFAACIADEAKYRRFAVTGLRQVAEPDSLIVETSTTISIFEAYNEVLDAVADRADLEALVLLHEDCEIVDPDFCRKVRERFADPDIAVLGAIGARNVTTLSWWEGEGRGRVQETRGLIDFGGGVHDVDSVDGLLLVLSPWAVRNLRFDAERFTGFHAYDVDFCFQARAAGKRVQVADLAVIHHTKGGYGDRETFRRADATWQAKWVEAPAVPAASRREWPAAEVSRPPSETPPGVSIVLCAGADRGLAERCLAALEADTGLDIGGAHELVLVDNGSGDDQAFEAWRDRAVIVRLSPARPESAARNAGAAEAGGEAIVFLSDDVLVSPGAVSALAGQALAPGVGAAGARVLAPDRTLWQASVAFASAGGGIPVPTRLFRGQAGDLPAALTTYDADAVAGACLAVGRADLVRAGGFDEEYEDGWEAVDLCMRLRAANRRIVYRGDIAVAHDAGRKRVDRNGDSPDARVFHSRWRGLLDTDDALLAGTFDAAFAEARPAPTTSDTPDAAAIVITGQPGGLAPEAAEARALVAACHDLGLAVAAHDAPQRFVAARLEPSEQALLERAWERPLRTDATTIQVPVGTGPTPEPAAGAIVRLAGLPKHLPLEAAAVWAASPALAHALTAAGVPAERVTHVPPAIPALAIGRGGGGLLALLPAQDLRACARVLEAVVSLPVPIRLLPSASTPQLAALVAERAPRAELLPACASESRFATLAATADVVLDADRSDPFERRALIAGASGAAIVTLSRGGSADAINVAAVAAREPGPLSAALLRALALGPSTRAGQGARVRAACGPEATQGRLRRLLGIEAPVTPAVRAA